MSYTFPTQLPPLPVARRVIASSTAMTLVNGMTSTDLATVFNATSSPSHVILSSDGSTNGYKLERGASVQVNFANTQTGIYVSTPGLTAEVSWIASASLSRW